MGREAAGCSQGETSTPTRLGPSCPGPGGPHHCIGGVLFTDSRKEELLIPTEISLTNRLLKEPGAGPWPGLSLPGRKVKAAGRGRGFPEEELSWGKTVGTGHGAVGGLGACPLSTLPDNSWDPVRVGQEGDSVRP